MLSDIKYLLSIIVPIYNAEKYLEKNMLTIIKQLNDKIELILINDGSNDKSAEICNKLVKLNSNVEFKNINNSGVSTARNVGITSSKGKYITFVDSDDYVSDNYVNTIFESIEKDADIFLFNNFIDGKSITIEKQFLKNEFQFLTLDEMYSLYMQYRINAPWDKVFKRNIVLKNNIRFIEKQNMGEDLIFCLEYMKYVKKVYSTSRSIYYHTINEEGLCHRRVNISYFEEQNLIYEKMIEFVNQYAPTHIDEVYITILRNITNFSGKLSKVGYGNREINNKLMSTKWYEDILKQNYHLKVDKLREFLLQKKQYRLISKVFKR